MPLIFEIHVESYSQNIANWITLDRHRSYEIAFLWGAYETACRFMSIAEQQIMASTCPKSPPNSGYYVVERMFDSDIAMVAWVPAAGQVCAWGFCHTGKDNVLSLWQTDVQTNLGILVFEPFRKGQASRCFSENGYFIYYFSIPWIFPDLRMGQGS